MSSPRDLIEQEAKSLIGEAIGMLQTISQTALPLENLIARKELMMSIRKLEQADELLRCIS